MRRALVVVLAILALLAALAAIAVTQRIALAEWWLRGQIAARGIAPASLRVASLDPSGIAIEALVLGPPDAPDLVVERAEADWSWPALRARRFDALRIRGVRLHASLADGGLSLGALDALWSGNAVGGAIALPAASIALDDAHLQVATPHGVADGTLSGTLDPAPEGILGSFSLDLAGAGLRAKGRFDVSGSLDAPSFRGSFAPSGDGPLTGRLELRGRVTRDGGKPGFDASLALRDVAVASGALQVTGIHGAIALRGPPLHTPKGQLVSFARADAGVPLRDGLVRFTLRRDGTLDVERAAVALAGGELFVEQLHIDPNARRQPVTLRARDVDLEQLLTLVTLPGLSGTGRLAGELPVVRDGDELHVAGGVLRASAGGGQIRYQPSDSVRAFAESRSADFGLAVQAFSDFHYEALEARLDGDLRGAMTIALHVRGTNPSFQDGRPVELNLNLDAHLTDLVRDATASYRIPREIEDRLRAFTEETKRP